MIEKLNERITFQHHEVIVDEYGNHRKDWVDYFTCSTYASTFAKDESPDVVTTDQRQITFQCRYCSELAPVTSTSYRAVFHDEIYDIVSVDPMNYQRKMIHFKCQKVQR